MSPLSYPSMKAVLTHMDPNFRLNLTRRLPSIRTAAFSVPCKMELFEPNTFLFQIDNLQYRVGVIRHYIDAETPEWVEQINGIGGTIWDQGVFGNENDSEFRPPTDEETFQKLENEQKLRKILYLLNRNDDPSAQESLENEAEDLKTRIMGYNNKVAYLDLKFLYFIQLSVFEGDVLVRKELINYSVPLKMAFEYLVENVFGRKSENCTHVLKIRGDTNFPDVFKINVLDPKMEVILEDGCLKQVTFEEHAPVFRNIIDGSMIVEYEQLHLSMKFHANDLDEALQLLLLLCQGLINGESQKRINDRVFPFRFSGRFGRGLSLTVSIRDVSPVGTDNLFYVELSKNC